MVNAWKLSTALFVRVGLSRTDIRAAPMVDLLIHLRSM